MDPFAVTLERAAHGAHKRLEALAPLLIEQRTVPGLERDCAPCRRGRTPSRRNGRVPIGHVGQCRPQTRHYVAYYRIGAQVEAEPDQSLAFLIGHGGVAEGQQQAARPSRGHALETPDCVGEIERTVEHLFGIARRRNVSYRLHPPLAPTSLGSEQRAEPAEPIALTPDRGR